MGIVCHYEVIFIATSLCRINKFKTKLLLTKQMASRHIKSLRQTDFSSYNQRRPTSFRVIMKSKSGFLMPNVDDVKDEGRPLRRKLNKTEILLGGEPDIRDYVKSMKNKAQNQFSKPMPQEDDNKSVRSVRQKHKQEQSVSLSRAISANQLLSSRKLPIPKLSVEQLERRVDYLIQIKLQNSKNNHEVKNIPDPIDREINELVSMLQTEIECDQNGERLENINKKIGILEKIMAQSLAQSQIAKKSYYKFINNRKPAKPLLNKYNINLQQLKQKVSGLMNNSASASIHYESISQSNYKAPDKKSYPVKASKTAYQFKNQPLHRSSYNRDFLVYSSVPEKPFREPPSQIVSGFSNSKANNSSYKRQFTKKKVEMVDFRELDCYKNKFRNLKVDFMDSRRTVTECDRPVDPEVESVENIVKIRDKMAKTVRYKTEHYSKNLQTESRLSFKGEPNKIKSLIKHKNLQDLTYAFKAATHA